MATRQDEAAQLVEIASVLDNKPIRRSMSLIKQDRSLTTTIMHEAVESEGIDRDDAGSADQLYFPDKGFLVIDLNSEGDDE